MTHILGIDPGKETGIATYREDNGSIELTTTTIKLKSNDEHGRLFEWWQHLHSINPRGAPKAVVFEQPFARGKAKAQLDAYCTAIRIWAMSNGVNWMALTPQQIKKAVTGNGAAQKYEVIAAVNELYPQLGDITCDNQADALAAIHYYRNRGFLSIKGASPRRKK